MENITYEKFIQNILNTRGRFACENEYHERHHIIPKCMGGTNDKDNLIDLFAREHFEAHRLLALEDPENDKLVYAWWAMCTLPGSSKKRDSVTPEEYEEARKASSEITSRSLRGENHPNYKTHKFDGERNPFFGKRHSEESKKKMSESKMGKCAGEKHPRALSVVQCDLNKNVIRVWTYIKRVADELQIVKSHISGCCKGKRKTAGGYRWYYLYDQIQKDGTVILGAISLGLIPEEEALGMLIL